MMMIIFLTIIIMNNIDKNLLSLIIWYKLILRLLKKITQNDSLGLTWKASPTGWARRPKWPDVWPNRLSGSILVLLHLSYCCSITLRKKQLLLWWLPYSGWQLAPRNGLIWKWIWPSDLFAIVESGVWDILKRIYPSLMALRLSVNGNQVTSVYKLTKNESSFFFFWILFVFALTSQQKRVAIYHSLAIHN